MGVAVDDAGREREAARIERFLRSAELTADRSDLACRHAEVAPHRRGAGAIEYFRVLDHEIEHLGFLLR